MNSIHNSSQLQNNQSHIQIQNLNKNKKQQQKRYRSLFHLILINCNYALGNFYFGYSIVYLNSIQFTTIISIYSITLDSNLALGLLVGCIPIGAGIGALTSNILLKNFSRRQSILIINCIAFIVGWLIYIQNFYILLIVRLIQGICVGSYSTFVPILVKQITPVEESGKLGIIPTFFIGFGIVFGFLFKFILSKVTNDLEGYNIWIYIFGFTLITITIQTLLISFIFNFQTPKYLIINDKYQQAKKILTIIYKQNHVQQVFQEKMKDAKKNQIGQNKNIWHSTNSKIILLSNNNNNENKQKPKEQIIKQTQQKQKEQKKQLQKSTPNKAIFLALHLGVFQQFTGINAVSVYSGETINQVYPELKQIFPIIINLIQIIAPLLLSSILSYAGRKIIIQFGAVFNILSTLLIGIGFLIIEENKQKAGGLIMGGLILFMINFSFTIGPLVWMYIPEIVQPKVVTFATAINWAAATLVLFLFPIIKGNILNDNPGLLFFFFAIWSFISLFINHIFIVETKDKTQIQIRQDFQVKTQDSHNLLETKKNHKLHFQNIHNQQSSLAVVQN